MGFEKREEVKKLEERVELKWSKIKWQQWGEKKKKLSDGLLMPLFGIYSKIENITTVFYFTKIDIVLERIRLVEGMEK